MNNLHCIIFDLDGVICTTDQYHYRAWKIIADKLNIDFTEETNNRLRGVSRMESLEIILEKHNGYLSSEEKCKLCDTKNEAYRQSLHELTPDHVDVAVREVLCQLRERKIKLAIGSSSKNARIILLKLGLTEYFDTIVDGNDIQNSKPAPDVFALAAHRLDIAAEKCLVIEDAVAGVMAAHAASMRCAALGSVAQLGCADFKIESVAEIMQLVDSWEGI